MLDVGYDKRLDKWMEHQPIDTRTEIVTVDLDSTLCDTEHRHHLIDRENGTDWVAYALACPDDSLVEPIARLVTILEPRFQIHYVSGRAGEAYQQTADWIHSHGLPLDGLWLDSNDFNGTHAEYKLHRIRDVEKTTGKKVILHIDDWAEVAAFLGQHDIPTVCVRTPYEIKEILG